MTIEYSTLMSVLNWNNLANFVGAPDGGTMYIVLSEDWDITNADFKAALSDDLLTQTPLQLPGTGNDLVLMALFIQLGPDGQYLNGGQYTIMIDEDGEVSDIEAIENNVFPAGEPDAGDTLLIYPSLITVVAGSGSS